MPDVEVIKGQTSDQVPPEESAEETSPEADAGGVEKTAPDQTVELLKEIDKKLTPKENTGPTPQQLYAARRDALKEKFNWDDSQVDAYEADKAESMAPIKEELAWTKLKTEAAHLTPEIEAEMKEELRQYPAHMRGDKVLLDKVYYMALGKKQSLNRHSERREADTTVSRGEDVVSRRIVNSGGSSVSLGGAGSSKPVKITDEEKTYAKKMRMSDEEYVKYRDTQYIDDFRKK